MEEEDGPRATVERAAHPVIRTAGRRDLEWVVRRHGEIYRQEQGWDERFGALVADIVADFERQHDPTRERCWVAELDSEVVGSVLVVGGAPGVAKLRLLLVEPRARGKAVGTRLVGECVAFAREAGYKKVTLWTDSGLLEARRLYGRTGFQKVEEEPHDLYGEGLVSETWELNL